jgi:monoamine oxidase
MEDVDVVIIGAGSAAGECLAGPLLRTCGGTRLSGEAVARQVNALLAAR